jgi:hypothetical protein
MKWTGEGLRYLPITSTCRQQMRPVKTNPATNIENISVGPHTRETVEDPIVKKEPPADNKMLAKYEEEPNVQDVPLQKELPADNKVVDKHEYEEGLMTEYEYPRCGNVMTETVDVIKILAYMDENYNISGQKGDKDEPFAALEREEPNVRVNPYSIDETYQEEDVANKEKTNGVAYKPESRGLP